MKVRVSNPALITDLAAFLARAACEARPGRGATIDVTLPHASSDHQARVYLDLYLAAWRGLHPNVRIELVEGPAARWPW